jgi:hypothetical protein
MLPVHGSSIFPLQTTPLFEIVPENNIIGKYYSHMHMY